MAVIEMPGRGGLRRLVLSHPAGSSAEVYLNGAHLTSWIPAGGIEWLFLSRSAVFAQGQTIRGGVPVVFPQFAERGPLPKHGFARVMPWHPVDDGDANGSRVVLELTDTDATRAIWPHRFRCLLTVELAERSVHIALDVHNTDQQPFSFTSALHTYLRVDDVRQAAVAGLQGCSYLDKPSGMAERTQAEPLVRVEQELDRVYRQAPRQVTLQDAAAGRSLSVEKAGFEDVVVWNPWQELAGELNDMAAGEYLQMICIEAAQAVEPVRLEPGATWHAHQVLRQS